MKIVILVEGRTEQAFLPLLKTFIHARLPAGVDRPKLRANRFDGRIPKQEKLRKIVEHEVGSGADAVIALTDVYTGSGDFQTADDAKNKMALWASHHHQFYPHTALHDFESWLIPFWDDIKRLAGSSRAAPDSAPERINHNKPPASVLSEVFLQGSKGRTYSKPRDAARILRGKDLSIAAHACPELKAFLNRILGLCGGQLIP